MSFVPFCVLGAALWGACGTAHVPSTSAGPAHVGAGGGQQLVGAGDAAPGSTLASALAVPATQGPPVALLGWLRLDGDAALLDALARSGALGGGGATVGRAADTTSTVTANHVTDRSRGLARRFALGLGFTQPVGDAFDLSRPTIVALAMSEGGLSPPAGVPPAPASTPAPASSEPDRAARARKTPSVTRMAAAAEQASILGRVIFAIPVTTRAGLIAALRQGGASFEDHGGVIAAQTSRGRLSMRVVSEAGPLGTFAVSSYDAPLVDGSWPMMRALLVKKSEAPLSLHVDMSEVNQAFGPQLESLLGRFSEATLDRSDPQAAYALRSARLFARFAGSLEALEFLVGTDAAGITVTARADGQPSGLFADYVAAQQPGAPWGLEFVPRDAVLVYGTRREAASSDDEARASADYLGDAATPPADEAARGRWREALGRAQGEMSGELVYAVWPGRGGGVGLGGAFRTRSPGARAATLAAYRAIEDGMVGVVGQALHLGAVRPALHVAVRRGAMRLQGVAVDTVDVDVRWPAKEAAAQALFGRLFGTRLSVAIAFVGEQAVFAVGRDARVRLGELIAIARQRAPSASTAPLAARGSGSGRGAPGLLGDPRFAETLAFHPEGRVSFTWLSTEAMSSFILGLLDVGRLESTRVAALHALLDAAGRGSIVTSTNAAGHRYELVTRLPASAVAGLPSVGALFWRMALSPLINPPHMPPLPLPPAQVTPSSPASLEPPSSERHRL